MKSSIKLLENEEFPASETRAWSVTKETFNKYYSQGKIVFPGDYDFLNIKKPHFEFLNPKTKLKQWLNTETKM